MLKSEVRLGQARLVNRFVNMIIVIIYLCDLCGFKICRWPPVLSKTYPTIYERVLEN